MFAGMYRCCCTSFVGFVSHRYGRFWEVSKTTTDGIHMAHKTYESILGLAELVLIRGLLCYSNLHTRFCHLQYRIVVLRSKWGDKLK